jgi:hypothetical protein
MIIRFGTYNLLEYDPSDSGQAPRLHLVEQIIRRLDLDVLAVQEIKARRPQVGAVLAELARRVGMHCHYAPDLPAIAVGPDALHVGLLWRPGIKVLPNSFRTSHLGYPGGESLVKLTFEFADGTHVQHGSHHGHPFCANKRTDQAAHLIGVMTRPSDGPAVVGMDSNGCSAERNPDGSYYDTDPYAGQSYPDLIFQTEWDNDTAGPHTYRADRRDGQMYLAGGFRDAAVLADAPWAPTVGHWPTDPHQRRRIDVNLVTGHFAKAIVSSCVADQLPNIDPDMLQDGSDHFPAVGAYETSAIDPTYRRLPLR